MKLVLIILFAGLVSGWAGELTVGRPFGSHMVLPMNQRVPVWGTAKPGVAVEVAFGEQTLGGRVGRDGKWRVTLEPLAAGSQGALLTVSAGDERLVLEDVLVGEVWLCSGQSNMDFPLRSATGGGEEAAQAGRFPTIRLLNLTGVGTGSRGYSDAERGRLTPEKFFEGSWKLPSPEAARGFSAVAWWAGRVIHETRNVPVGLVENAVGGSGAEAWLPWEVLASRSCYEELRGEHWMSSEKMSSWARGRARLNLGRDSGNHPFRPGFLFEAGVSWWRGFPLTGVLWYQGETNAEMADQAWNGLLIEDLVRGWRQELARPDLRFVMVQLPRIGGSDPLRKYWPEFRAVQARVAEKLAGVDLVVTKDLGWDTPNVHPPDKRPVGERVGREACK